MKNFTCIIFWVVFFGTFIYHGLGKKAKTNHSGGKIKTSTEPYKYIFKNDCNHIYNKEKQTLAIQDYQNYINAYFCGNTGDAFLISAYSNLAVYIPGKSSDETWNIKQNTFKEYLEKMQPLPKLYHIGLQSGVVFTSLSITEKIKEKLHSILSTLGKEYQSDKCNSFGIALEISKLSSPLKKLDLKIFKETELDVSFDVQGELATSNALIKFFEPFGGYEALAEKNITLEIPEFYNVSGVQMTAYFMEKTHKDFDLGKVLQPNFGTESTTLSLFSHLLGDTFLGYDGFVKVSTLIVEYLYGEASEQALVATLEEYFTIKDNEKNSLMQKWNDDVDVFYKIVKKYKLETKLEADYKALQSLKVENWIVKGININKVQLSIIEEKNSNCVTRSVRKVLKQIKGIH